MVAPPLNVNFITRQTNEVAHNLSRMAISSNDSFHLFIEIPNCIQNIIMNNMSYFPFVKNRKTKYHTKETTYTHSILKKKRTYTHPKIQQNTTAQVDRPNPTV